MSVLIHRCDFRISRGPDQGLIGSIVWQNSGFHGNGLIYTQCDLRRIKQYLARRNYHRYMGGGLERSTLYRNNSLTYFNCRNLTVNYRYDTLIVREPFQRISSVLRDLSCCQLLRGTLFHSQCCRLHR